MRLLHPRTIETIVLQMQQEDFENATVTKRQVLSHAWSEVFKFKATEQTHPKMFISNDYELGVYLGIVYAYGKIVGCKMDACLLDKYPTIKRGFENSKMDFKRLDKYFDDMYLFGDCNSLYYKGVNMFKYVYQDWRKYVPVESLEEIQRQLNKTILKKKSN